MANPAIKKARLQYKHAGSQSNPWRAGDTFVISMLGCLSRFFAGNKKIIDAGRFGHNTSFQGIFKIANIYSLFRKQTTGWKLDYNQPDNSRIVRGICDRVRWIDGDYLVGKFYWHQIRLGWFTMRRERRD